MLKSVCSVPFWAIAVEGRLDFLFPLLVPVFKGYGAIALIGGAIGLPLLRQKVAVYPWYIVLLASELSGCYWQHVPEVAV